MPQAAAAGIATLPSHDALKRQYGTLARPALPRRLDRALPRYAD